MIKSCNLSFNLDYTILCGPICEPMDVKCSNAQANILYIFENEKSSNDHNIKFGKVQPLEVAKNKLDNLINNSRTRVTHQN